MDEAGRGPVIGPIVFGLVIVNENQEKILRTLGVNDSKQLSEPKRESLKEIIVKNSEFSRTHAISANEINDYMSNGTNLNQIEIIGFTALLEQISQKIDELQLDAADVNAARFGSNFEHLVSGKIDSRHKGDSIFISVAAASIIAKTERDDQVKNLQKRMIRVDPNLPSFGSGYPTDATPFLKEFYAKYRTFPTIARTHWKTCKKIKEKFDQAQLDDYF